MIGFLQNMTVQIQRRTVLTTDVLGAVNYGNEVTWPVIYPSALARIEFWTSDINYGPTGEHINPSVRTVLFLDFDVVPQSQDRITILTSDDPNMIGKKYIINTVDPQWDLTGLLHHYIVELLQP